MKILNFKKKSLIELKKILKIKKDEYFKIKFEHNTRSIKNTSIIKKLKKDIARILTEINSKKIII